MENNTKQFIEDLIEYFKIHTDQINDFMSNKVDMKDKSNLYVTAIVKDRLREVIKDMHKYICTKCKKIWYVPNVYANAQKCECGGKIKKGVDK